MEKIAIMFNEKSEIFEAYHYSKWFRIFGATCFGYVSSWSDEDGLIKRSHNILYGKLKFIRIVEV